MPVSFLTNIAEIRKQDKKMPRKKKDVALPTESYTTTLLYWCAVPSCNSNRLNCPLKSFFPIPNETTIRRIWLKRANIKVEDEEKYVTACFCEDHFEAPTAIFPSRFECQYFMHYDMPYPAPPIQERHPLDKVKRRVPRIRMHGSSFKRDARPPPKTKSRHPVAPPNYCLNHLRLRENNNFLAWVVRMEHDYQKRDPTPLDANNKKIIINFIKKAENQTSTKINDNFLRNNRIYVETNRNVESNESTDSAESLCTFKCNRCELEFIHGNELQDHIKEKHIDNKQVQKLLKTNELYNNGSTFSKTVMTFKCVPCGVEFAHNSDLQRHVNNHFINVEEGLRQGLGHLGGFDEQTIQNLDDFEAEPWQYCEDADEPIDIKPEIFQCSKCPSSFINEEDMSKHLQIMHGDLTDLTRHIKKLKNNKQDAKSCIDLSNTSNTEQSVEITQKGEHGSRCEVNHSGNNFAEIETSVEIKRELEDIDFSIDNQNMGAFDLGLDPIIYTESFFNAFHSETNSNDANTNMPLEHSEFNGEDLNSNETRNINRDYLDCQITANSGGMATFKCSFQKKNSSLNLQCVQPVSGSGLVQQNANSELSLCKKCSTTFPSQEELLNHLHELVNTKAKLYSDAKKVFKADSVRFKSPDSISRSGDKQYLNDAELLDYIHKVYDKSGNRNIILQVVKYAEEDDNDALKPLVDLTTCRCCAKPLPSSTILCKRKDKICRWCKRKERIQERRRKSARAKLYASAKNMQLKNEQKCANPKKDYDKALAKMLSHKPTNISTLNEVLQSVSQIFNKPESEKAQTETDENSSSFEENDLLKPIREEDEKVLVQPYDPTRCKSCLIPLNKGRAANSCDKCKKLEVSNEKLRKSNGKRISLENRKVPYVLLHRLPDVYSDKKCCTPNKSRNNNECNICHLKFSNRLYLRKHVVRCHL